VWLQQHVQEFISSLQSQMQQHRKGAHGKHTTKVQSQNATRLQWSPKACQTWQKIGFTHQMLCNSIPWHQSIPSHQMLRNDMHHHLARQPHQRSQNLRCQKMRHVCQRKNCNFQTIQIQPTTSHQLQQQSQRCLQTQTTFPHACTANHPQRWWVNQWQKSKPNTQSCHRFCQVQCLPSWCLTGRTVRTSKTKLFSICFQSTAALASETIPTICCKSVALCCLSACHGEMTWCFRSTSRSSKK